ncbi:MAG: HAD family phosphatase [Prevotella sp.]|nr:HAD family phosphatase [Prevotella sp.]
MHHHIKNIVFDFGCVLVDLNKQRCVDAFKRIGADNISKYVDESRQEDLFLDLEKGKIDTHAFCNAVRRKAPSCIASDEAICNAWNMLLTGIPLKRLKRLIMLKDKFRLFLLSNTNPVHWNKAVEDYFPCDGFGVDDYFEKTFLSYEMHLVKPDSRIFRRMLVEAHITAEETMFIDDSPINCAAASELGITSLLVSNGDQWINNSVLV